MKHICMGWLVMSVMMMSCSYYTSNAAVPVKRGICSQEVTEEVFKEYEEYMHKQEASLISKGFTKKGDEIESIYTVVTMRKDIKLEAARRLVVDALENIRASVEKKAAMTERFPSSNIDLAFILVDDEEKCVVDGLHMSKITVHDGFIRYYDGDTKAATGKVEMELVHQEWYDELVAQDKGIGV
jgi:hypothetical protein